MFLTEFLKGIYGYGRAHRTILQYRLWPYMVIPGFLSFCYIFLLALLGRAWFGDIAAQVNAMMPGFMQGEVMMMLTRLMLWILLTLTVYVTYQPVILVILSPVLSFLSEQVEYRVLGQPGPPFCFGNLVRDILRSVGINARNILKMIVLTIAAWLLVLVPLVGAPVSAALILLIQSFYNGFSLTDYTLERKRFSVRESVRFGKENRFRIAGVGAGFMLMLLVPVLGWLAAPSYGTVTATLFALDRINSGGPDVPPVRPEQ